MHKHKPFTRLMLMAAFLLLGVMIAGCVAPAAAPAEGEDAAMPAADDQIVLRVGTGDSGEGLTPHQEIIRRFEEANPDIKVQLEPVSGSDYYGRLLTQIAANDAPDIMNIGDDAVPRFVMSEAFLSLDEFIARRGWAGHQHLSARAAGTGSVGRAAVVPAQGLLTHGRLLQQGHL